MSARLIPAKNSVTVRMYRQGHGDCFLLAFATETPEKPYYVLIDCGLKPGSQDFIHPSAASATGFKKGPKIADVVKHIGDSTGNRIDLMVVTHEHQDHVNGIWKKTKPYFKDIEIEKAWFAWTEDPDDDLANTLRERHKDQLLGLLEARKQLLDLAGADAQALRRLTRLESLLELETGSEKAEFGMRGFFAAEKDITKSINKQGLKLIKDKAAANGGVEYLRPGDERKIAAAGTNVYVFGPPRDEDLLTDERLRDGEGFPDDELPTHGFSMLAAVNTPSDKRKSPFDQRFRLSFETDADAFVKNHYGHDKFDADADKAEVAADAPWRRIDNEWLYSAESLALQLNTGINNTSLVLAFELPQSGKVLLFAGDAQRGNWVSWPQNTWGTGSDKRTVRELLGRTVLYKVSHHCSHNATLAGEPADEHPNLSWMGTGKYAPEFTAMITAVNKWALTKNNPPWRHPLPSIRKALEEKTNGRLFQTDEANFVKKASLPAPAWNTFLNRTTVEEMYFDYVIDDTAL